MFMGVGKVKIISLGLLIKNSISLASDYNLLSQNKHKISRK